MKLFIYVYVNSWGILFIVSCLCEKKQKMFKMSKACLLQKSIEIKLVTQRVVDVNRTVKLDIVNWYHKTNF